MELKRVRVRGRQQKTYKEWRSECGNYRLTWWCEFQGVEITPASYYATVKTEGANGKPWWNFVGRMGPYKTQKKAIEEIDRHRKLWAKFIELSNAPGRRSERLKELVAKGGTIFKSMPVYVRPQADPVLVRMLFPPVQQCNDQDDDIEISTSSDEVLSAAMPSTPPLEPPSTPSTTTETTSPAKPAKAKAKSVTPPTEMSSKGTSSRRGTSAKAVEAPAAAPKKPPKKRTAKKSPSTKPTSKRGGDKKPSAKAASPNSRKKSDKR